MKTKTFYSFLIFLFFFFEQLPAQTILQDVFDINWSLEEQTRSRANQELCSSYTFLFNTNGKGSLSLQINFLSGNQKPTTFSAIIPFNYKIQEDASEQVKTILLAVNYYELQFRYEQVPKFDKNWIVPEHRDYLDAIKQKLSHQTETYRLKLEGESFLLMEGFSLPENSRFVKFRKGTAIHACNIEK